ncbi:hypothetical protein LTR36_002609 [Oleoguttula mirabilis]|uniref:Nitrogen regulatory protein areA GATA-like domain-containing protein n=1 Tax=Oleoguttula mirabilis TaxID=1507867 RepID=A0AAV9JK98_9PEZI|nr:hypothetical protein LTR36_002609 [Oleoguttula mirabilis]
MAEVLQVPRALGGHSLYQSSGLRRSHPSSSSLFLDAPALSATARSAPPASPSAHAEHHELRPASPAASSPSSSPPTPSFDFSNFDSKSSTPASSGISLEQKYGQDDDMDFPDYGGVQFYRQSEDFDASQSSDDPVESTTTDTTRSDSPLPTPTVLDDTAIKQEPKQHVDYLSHEWREEDIWSSWRHIVSQRKVYGQRSRLENASWRTWAKSKYHLRTVSPETLNWLKESDVTWLYGPLKPADSHPITSNFSEPASRLSKNNSFVSKKPILKKRSMSEVMLQKSISTSSLVKQAAAAVQAQQVKTPTPRRLPFHRAHSDFVSSSSQSEAPSRDQMDYFTTRSSSDDGTPSDCKDSRHIRFDDKVEQCIAVDCKEGEFDEQSDSDPEDEHRPNALSDSSSDDGVLIMKRKKRPGFRLGGGKGSGKNSRSGSHNGRKTIETLPATTLKYRTDSPDVSSEAQQHHTFGRDWNAPSRISPSASQETLRPSHPSKNFLIGTQAEKDDGALDMNSSWSFGASNPKSSLGAATSSDDDDVVPASSWRRRDSVAVHRARNGTPAPSREEADDYMSASAATAEGLRRTNSGMLMPYDEDEDDLMAVGLFGRVSETINTARDIAHVIWNVGWRK